MEVLELRTYRDLQYVRSMETLMRSLDARLRAADGSLSAKSFQVSLLGFRSEVKGRVGNGAQFFESRIKSGKTEGWLGSRVQYGPNVKDKG